MKKLALASALALTSLFTVSAQAVNDSASVPVTVALTSKCVFGAVPTLAFVYTSFQVAASQPTSLFNVKCTNTLAYTVGFTSGASPSATDSATDTATNLAYTLALSSTVGPGTGVDKPYTITGTMAANQAGTCATATCSGTNAARTVYVWY
jgi:spore coat protein U-like protein